MNRWKQHIPQGVQDYLPGECYNKRRIEQIIRKTFYTGDEIESPVFEYYDVFTGDKEYIEQENMFKIVEAGGRIQVLRPDITMPIARIVGTKLKSLEAPIRLSYLSNVYRYEELQTGKQREIAQAGIELLGVGSPEGDASHSYRNPMLFKPGTGRFSDRDRRWNFKGLVRMRLNSKKRAAQVIDRRKPIDA